ncbi:bax inhibitor 1 [Toxorhynchites rutilus septentrionalis]|uniref:bax inhibitor 1 n=1 Tax=Toxorhynchites rutilus septentrionalis TaxID=329112 RepID=UPI0024786E9A|nr:bax inhibitor 1 [Toxorhynchites rutilus septentrionalis]
MATSFTNFSYERFMRNMGQNIEPSLRYHLSKVYACLSATCVAAAVGSAIHIQGIWHANLLSALIAMGLVLGLVFTPDNGKNFNMRLGMLLGFGTFTGHALGLLLEQVLIINPAIVVTALIGTATIFTCLSAASVLAKRGSYLFLGGILMSTLTAMALINIGNLMFRSYFIHDLNLYVGLAVMAGFVLFDTQMIMEKHRMGSNDCISHSLDLFYDVIGIFRRLLVLLSQKEQNNQRKKRND